MLKNELKAALAIMGVSFVPLLAHADQSMSNGNNMNNPSYGSQGQQPGYVPGEMVKSGQMPGGYNQSAAYMCDDGWDVFITADYLYWKWQQDTFQGATQITEASTILSGFSGSNNAMFANPGYKSGFQVGLGFNMHGMDDWQIYSEYTWYRNTNDKTFTGTTANPLVLTSAAFRADQTLAAEAHVIGSLSTEARLGFQALDFLLQRPFYFGKKLTANFGTGLRAQWISQKFTASSSSLTDSIYTATGVSGAQKTTSWSLGPKFALDTNWLLGYGLKIMANVSQSILYTSYNQSASSSGTVTDVASFTSTSTGLSNYGTLRPVTESFLGLGWGSYFADDSFHFDLSIGYDFNVYWDYNMRYATTSQTIGNMYLHGMNIQVRFDF